MDLDLTDLNNWLSGFIHPAGSQPPREACLQTMQVLCNYFDHPESFAPCFHITGSKGKGTIAANISAILRAAGFKTGAFMSPHVSHFTERIGTGSEPFPEETYAAAFRQLRLGVDDLISKGELQKSDLTWFMLVTIFAMLCFRIEKVDFAIYEVGIGGRFDATNIITPVACAFATIELEHTKLLGNTPYKIATEKAGILKYKVPAVSAPQRPDVCRALTIASSAQQTEVEYIPSSVKDYEKQDALVAKLAVKKHLPNIPDELMDAALKSVHLPGRYEKITSLKNYPDIPYVLIDVAHTDGSITQVMHRIRDEKLSGKLLMYCHASRPAGKIIREITCSKLFPEVFIVKPSAFERSNTAHLQQLFKARHFRNVTISDDAAESIPQLLAKCNAEKSPLIVLGSFYLAGDVKKFLQ